jgi:hypothetical protein
MEQCEYVRRALEAYRLTPGTTGVVRRADRLFAAQLHDRGVTLQAVENALILAAARRSAKAGRCAAAREDSITGLLLAGDRGSPAT